MMKTGKNSIFRYFGIIVTSFLVGLLAGKLAIPVSQTNALSDLVVNENSSENSAVIEKKDALSEAAFDNIANDTVSTVQTTAVTTTTPAFQVKDLYIPGVVNTTVSYTSRNLPDPDYGPLQYQSLIYAHRTMEFYNLPATTVGTIITVRNKQYQVVSSMTYSKINDKELQGNEKTYNMIDLFSYDGIVIMTCDNGSKNRWLVFADPV